MFNGGYAITGRDRPDHITHQSQPHYLHILTGEPLRAPVRFEKAMGQEIKSFLSLGGVIAGSVITEKALSRERYFERGGCCSSIGPPLPTHMYLSNILVAYDFAQKWTSSVILMARPK